MTLKPNRGIRFTRQFRLGDRLKSGFALPGLSWALKSDEPN